MWTHTSYIIAKKQGICQETGQILLAEEVLKNADLHAGRSPTGHRADQRKNKRSIDHDGRGASGKRCVQPCCERQDFLGWFELWLDQQESVDYFQDYQ